MAVAFVNTANKEASAKIAGAPIFASTYCDRVAARIASASCRQFAMAAAGKQPCRLLI
jgi:hypothetical protein